MAAEDPEELELTKTQRRNRKKRGKKAADEFAEMTPEEEAAARAADPELDARTRANLAQYMEEMTPVAMEVLGPMVAIKLDEMGQRGAVRKIGAARMEKLLPDVLTMMAQSIILEENGTPHTVTWEITKQNEAKSGEATAENCTAPSDEFAVCNDESACSRPCDTRSCAAATEICAAPGDVFAVCNEDSVCSHDEVQCNDAKQTNDYDELWCSAQQQARCEHAHLAESASPPEDIEITIRDTALKIFRSKKKKLKSKSKKIATTTKK